MKRRIPVKIEDYKNYLYKYGSNKLDSKNEIYGIGSLTPFYKNINEEIFEGTQCSYKILERSNTKIVIKFNSKSNSEYRLDLIKDTLDNIWHIAFSEFDRTTHDYEVLSEKDESIDVFSRLIWILKDLKTNFEYCIGATGDEKKDRIYQYMMRFVSNWEKRDSNAYTMGWGIYFKI